MSSENEDVVTVKGNTIDAPRVRWLITKQGLNVKRVLQVLVWNYTKREEQWVDVPEVDN